MKTLTNLNEEKPSLVTQLAPAVSDTYTLGSSTSHWEQLYASQNSFQPNGKSVLRCVQAGSSPPLTKALNTGYEFYFQSTTTPKVLYQYHTSTSPPRSFNVTEGSLIYLVNAGQLFIYTAGSWKGSSGFS